MEPALFDTLYKEYAKAIYRYAFVKTGNKDTAEDITADTFCKFYESTLSQEEGSIANPKALLYRIASNLIIDTYRKKAYRESKTDYETEIETLASNEDIIKTKHILDTYKEVRYVMTNLKAEYEDILILHFVEDLSIAEISKILECTDNSARVKLHRAIQALKKQVEKNPENISNPLTP